MWLDDIDTGFFRRVRIRAERLQPERQPYGAPRESAGPGDRLDVLEADDLWRSSRQKTGVSV
jgi:hypothetical protein